MKGFGYKGPAGEIQIKDPLAVRLVESSWWLTLWTLGFMAWGGYYLYFAPPEVFMSKQLSPGHMKLKTDCMACHSPFVGVTDESCGSADCHQDKALDTIHNSINPRCISCHPEHTDGDLLPMRPNQRECAECHKKLRKDPASVFFAQHEPPRRTTFVSRKLFKHRSHQFPPYYKCWQCHCLGDQTIDTPTPELFLMKSCLKCHEEKDCNVCHHYHDQRDPRPKLLSCIKAQFAPDLQFKTMSCTAENKRPIGYGDLNVCETNEPVKDFGKTALPGMPEPETTEGGTTP